MADPLIGRISNIFSDEFILSSEFQDLEQALFAGDGLVDSVELGLLDQLAYPHLYETDSFIWSDPNDIKRLHTILDRGAYTLERYVEFLGDQGLTPQTPVDRLEQVAQNGLEDELPTIEWMMVYDNGTFDLGMKVRGEDVFWRYRGEDETEILDIQYDASLPEIYAALEKFSTGEITEREKNDAEEIIRKISSIAVTSIESDADLQKETLATYQAGGIAPLTENFVDNTPVLRDQHDLPPIFCGLQPDEKTLEALKMAVQSVSPGHMRLLRNAGVKIQIVNYPTIARDFFNTYPQELDPAVETDTKISGRRRFFVCPCGLPKKSWT